MASDGNPYYTRTALVVPSVFERLKERVRAGEITPASSAAYRQLLADAESLLPAPLLSVTQKQHVPPSGDKRDYFSLSVYYWPDPNSPTGLPYVPRDGMINPEVDDYDRPHLALVCTSVDTLATAYALGRDERFAAKAAAMLRTWFVDEQTRMNPNMLFAQYIPGENVTTPWKDYPARFVPGTGGRKGIWVSFGGVIEDHPLITLTDSIRMLRGSAAWTIADDEAVRHWYRAYADWLLTHQHGLDEAGCRNNHASWYWAGIAAFLQFVGDDDRVRQYSETYWPPRLQIQIEPDGSQPEELCRAISKSYTAFTICSFTNWAIAASACGFDAWAYATPDGRSVGKAIDWMLPYLTGQAQWTWRQVKPFDDESIIPPLVAAAEGLNRPVYREVASGLKAGAFEGRTRLLFGL
ncbi:MAG TPA: alginate lyase family protein [Tepidisphaeraceae bacterium]|jgi:hypothetical protein|nr:alginate lyase family protein [Tepidisphaeraceae bacterium]